MATIERHNPDGVSKGRVTLYNHCVRVTNPTATLYLAGQLARDEQGQTVGVGDIRAQTEQVIKNLRTILRSEGADLENLVKVTVYTTDMRFFDAIAATSRATCPPAPSSRSASSLSPISSSRSRAWPSSRRRRARS